MVEPARAALPPQEPLTPDWVISHEMARRYHNVVIQEKESLNGADTVKAWEYVHAHGLIDTEHGARGALFIVLDQGSIDLLLATPSKEELSKMSSMIGSRQLEIHGSRQFHQPAKQMMKATTQTR
jgi:hypothetical protein